MRQLDLFAGIGGISLAAEWAGIETVAFCEKEPFAQGILRRRFPGRPIYDDVFTLTREVLERDGIIGGGLPDIEIVAGGFPCQPFSHAGKRTGTADDRYLWPEMCRIVRELRPSWVFAENVDGLVSMAQSDWSIVMEDETTVCEEAEMVIETIRKDLADLGYQSVPIVIPACSVGATHRRYRIFILGYTERSGCGGDEWWGTDEELEGRRANVAYAESWGRGKARGGFDRPKERPSGCCEDVADSYSSGREERYAIAVADESRYGSRCSNPIRSDGAAQPGMGGGPYELSDWLDGWGMNPLDALINFISSFPQPALIGQEQYVWEPPRVATGIKNRSARLKALGNAVDPLQALPVLYGIQVMHDFLQRGGRLV